MAIEGSEASKQDTVWLGDNSNCSAYPINLPRYTIGDLAVEYGITLRALRFYETKGLLNPERNGSSRLYSEEDRRRLKLIIKGKQLGFTLREIVELITTGPGIGTPNILGLTRQQCIEQIKLLERQKRELEDAILELQRTCASLEQQELNDDPPLGAEQLSEQA